MEIKPKTAVLSTLAILFLIVLFQNTQTVTLRFLFWHLSLSWIILVPLILLGGFLAGYYFGRRSW